MSEIAVDRASILWSVGGARTDEASAVSALADRPLLVLMHGYGSHEGDLFSLAPMLPREFVCAALRAPLAPPGLGAGAFSWFPIAIDATGMPSSAQPQPERFDGTPPHAAAVAVLDWLDRLEADVAAASGAPLAPVALLGFSQGGCMVTSLLRLRPARFSAGAVCSGFVAPGRFDGDAALATARPPVFWGRDVADPVIDEARVDLTSEWLPAHSTLETRLYPGMGHSINQAELADVVAFLTEHALPAAEGGRR